MRQSISHFKILEMNLALRITLIINLFLVSLACNEAPQPKSLDASSSFVATSPVVEIPDSIILQKLPLLSGSWKGIGKDRGRSLTWAVTNDKLEGTYLANKKVKEDYSKIFRFRVKDGAIFCFPSDYGSWKCGTPEAAYRLTEETDSSYTFVVDRRPHNMTISTLQFSFEGKKKMTYRMKHQYEDEEYPDYHVVRHFQKSL